MTRFEHFPVSLGKYRPWYLIGRDAAPFGLFLAEPSCLFEAT